MCHYSTATSAFAIWFKDLGRYMISMMIFKNWRTNHGMARRLWSGHKSKKVDGTVQTITLHTMDGTTETYNNLQIQPQTGLSQHLVAWAFYDLRWSVRNMGKERPCTKPHQCFVCVGKADWKNETWTVAAEPRTTAKGKTAAWKQSSETNEKE